MTVLSRRILCVGISVFLLLFAWQGFGANQCASLFKPGKSWLLRFPIRSTTPISPEDVWTKLRPAIQKISKRHQPSVESEITQLETRLMKVLTTDPASFPSFALRGVGVDSLAVSQDVQNSLGILRKNMYVGKAGGNFFVLNSPSVFSKFSTEELLGRLYSSVAAAQQYAMRGKNPIVLFIKVDEQFPLYASGGNDGINGDFPHTFTVKRREFLTRNMDVASLTKPSHTGKLSGLVAEGVPATHVVDEIGAVNPPKFLFSPDPWSKSKADVLLGQRWIYMNVLKNILNLVSTGFDATP